MSRTIETLRRDHRIDAFNCGSDALNVWFKRFALANQAANAARTYVGVHDDVVVGFYSLAVGQVAHEPAPERLAKGLARHPIPVMLLARLGVEIGWQRQGVARALLIDAAQRTLQAAEIAGLRALAVHAKDENAQAFYLKFGFLPSPTDPFHLFVLVKDLGRLRWDRPKSNPGL